MKTITINEKTFETTEQCYGWLSSCLLRAKATGDYSAILAIIVLGKMSGEVVEILS